MSAVVKSAASKSPSSLPAEAPPPFLMRRFTVEEYHRLLEVGILQEGDPYELLDGWITRKMTKNPPHEVCLRLLHLMLSNQVPAGWMFDSQLAITLPTSEPEPDGMIVKGVPRDYVKRHPRPEDLELVIEVSEASLQIDRRKAELYARAGIRRYWIINLIDGIIEDFSQPNLNTGKYQSIRSVEPTEMLTLTLGTSKMSVTVADLLP